MPLGDRELTVVLVIVFENHAHSSEVNKTPL